MKYSKIKERIITFSEGQRLYKPQRKTVYFTGKRTIDAKSATNIVRDTNYLLRHLFVAYQIIKGKEPILPKRVEYNPALTKTLVLKYTPKEEEKAV